jgi:hypothetical protein
LVQLLAEVLDLLIHLRLQLIRQSLLLQLQLLLLLLQALLMCCLHRSCAWA